MHVRFLYFEGCPSHDVALQRLQKVMTEEGVGSEVEVIKVETTEEAERFRFPGSPTILINGSDIEPPLSAQHALTCRAYRLEDGRISPLPSETMIRKAIRKASAEKS